MFRPCPPQFCCPRRGVRRPPTGRADASESGRSARRALRSCISQRPPPSSSCLLRVRPRVGAQHGRQPPRLLRPRLGGRLLPRQLGHVQQRVARRRLQEIHARAAAPGKGRGEVGRGRDLACAPPASFCSAAVAAMSRRISCRTLCRRTRSGCWTSCLGPSWLQTTRASCCRATRRTGRPTTGEKGGREAPS